MMKAKRVARKARSNHQWQNQARQARHPISRALGHRQSELHHLRWSESHWTQSTITRHTRQSQLEVEPRQEFSAFQRLFLWRTIHHIILPLTLTHSDRQLRNVNPGRKSMMSKPTRRGQLEKTPFQIFGRWGREFVLVQHVMLSLAVRQQLKQRRGRFRPLPGGIPMTRLARRISLWPGAADSNAMLSVHLARPTLWLRGPSSPGCWPSWMGLQRTALLGCLVQHLQKVSCQAAYLKLSSLTITVWRKAEKVCLSGSVRSITGQRSRHHTAARSYRKVSSSVRVAIVVGTAVKPLEDTVKSV